ncbi:transmembrane protein 168 isoform X2 [Mauremys reevesii]|uniref:transmembrane protein 168 isoform X2 n=1 Tax=Mauremys reevesii TaxID=260615 RepID=UPI00193F1D2E|nr:transmembrane protein 168 isoform X2 [Mauremys reevesii]
MCRSLRYCVSHCLYVAMTRLEEANREVNMHSSVRYLGYLARINILVAICLGLYVRWEKSADALILVIFILGLFVLGIASILYYYFSMEAASLSLSNLWFGFLLGLLCFLDNSSFKSDVKEETTKYLLLTSIVTRILCALVERICGCVHHRPTLLTAVEFLELVGFAIASTTMLVEKSMSIILLVVALAMLIIDLRMKSFLAIPNLAIFGALASLLFFTSLNIPTNPFALACFFSCLISDPLLDVYFSGLSVTERWKPYLYRGRICRRLSVISVGPKNGIFMSVFLIVLPLESMAHGLFHELGNCLGGTCVGYAVVIPTNFCSPDGQPTLLPPEHVQELNLRSTGMLNTIQRFFAYHMIETYGCDYSTSGLSFDTLHSKLKSFLELRTADGPRHDTYVLYYSGHSHGTGEWALAGGDALRLDTLLEWWREKNGSFCSRLIIVLDCENSLPWVKEVRKVNDLYIAVQGAEFARVVDIEEADPPQLGDFTREWVEYNCNPDSSISWSEKGRAVKAVYGVSKRWSDYTLHLPTGSDIAKHWMMYFPRVTYPLVHLANWFCGLNLFWVCKACFRCLKRLKMNWFLPTVLDTGQGFKLVKS